MEVLLIMIAALLFIYCYFVLAQYFSFRKFNYLQQTSFAILIGAILGATLEFLTHLDISSILNGDVLRQLIFLVLLPPIMFEDGYNFKKRKFFQNIFYINLYGLIGTFLHLIVFYLILYLCNNLYVSVSDINQPIVLRNWEILLTSAALCSIEPIVSEKVVNKQRYPKLFSIIFGEALFKDTISVTLFDSALKVVQKCRDQNIDIDVANIGEFVLQFLYVVSCSLLIGFITGILTTLIFKHWRFLLAEKGISEMALTLLTGFFSYLLSEELQCSGVISMLFCGTVMSHFNAYNLTQSGKEVTKISIQTLKIGASGFIFFLLGFYIFNLQTFVSESDGNQKSTFSVSLLGFTFVALIAGRLINILIPSLIGYAILGEANWRLHPYQAFILFGAGLIKGAVPFALIITMPQTGTSNTVETNVILIVFLTSLLFSSILPKVERMLLKKMARLRWQNPSHPSLKDSLILAYPEKINEMKSQLAINFFGRFKSTTQKYWHKFEEGFLKPHLIFDYYRRKDTIREEKLNQRKQEYDKYIRRYCSDVTDNILSLDNEDANRFIDLKIQSDSSDSGESNESDAKVIKVHRKDIEQSPPPFRPTMELAQRITKDIGNRTDLN